jgi:hypothetical protein
MYRIEREENLVKSLVVIPEGNRNLEDLVVDGRVVFQYMLQLYGVKVPLDGQ